MIYLGNMYYYGEGTSDNSATRMKKCFDCFYDAALEGDAKAARELGYLYRYGIGRRRNIIEAFRWYAKANKWCLEDGLNRSDISSKLRELWEEIEMDLIHTKESCKELSLDKIKIFD